MCETIALTHILNHIIFWLENDVNYDHALLCTCPSSCLMPFFIPLTPMPLCKNKLTHVHRGHNVPSLDPTSFTDAFNLYNALPSVCLRVDTWPIPVWPCQKEQSHSTITTCSLIWDLGWDQTFGIVGNWESDLGWSACGFQLWRIKRGQRSVIWRIPIYGKKHNWMFTNM